MKIIAVLESSILHGGGFNQSLTAILQMQTICNDRFEFEVLSTRAENISVLDDLGVRASHVRPSRVNDMLSRLSLNPWWHLIQKRLKLIGSFEKMLVERGCDLVYFLSPSNLPAALQRLNYVLTVWDLCHRDTPEFPELRAYTEFFYRERFYKHCLAPAVTVLTDSTQLADAMSRRYGIDRERLLPMPFAPSPFLGNERASDKDAVLERHGIEEGYFFYPAQFWSHKNHIRILEALVTLREQGNWLRAVFAGGDMGNMDHVRNQVRRYNLDEQVRILGFVPAEDMRGLYEGCLAVVMPTYFGPTNLPPLEAWMMNKPLIYSAHLKEQVGDAALCVDPDNERELADAMLSATKPDVAANIVALGQSRLAMVRQHRAEAESDLLERLRRFEKRRGTWA